MNAERGEEKYLGSDCVQGARRGALMRLTRTYPVTKAKGKAF